MAHVVNTPYHELPYGEFLTRIFNAFDVPLDEKDATHPVMNDYFKESFLNLCGLKRENGIWWLGSGEKRRIDELEGDSEEESEGEESDSEEIEDAANHEESTPAGFEGEHSHSETEVKIAKKSSESVEDFFDATDVDIDTTEGPAQPVLKKKLGKSTKARRVNPFSPELDYNLIGVQAQLGVKP
ncbi:hypothetical protein Dimus_016277 [Dionaea muscipula]